MNKLVKLIVVKITQIYFEWNSSKTEKLRLWHTQYTHTYIHVNMKNMNAELVYFLVWSNTIYTSCFTDTLKTIKQIQKCKSLQNYVFSWTKCVLQTTLSILGIWKNTSIVIATQHQLYSWINKIIFLSIISTLVLLKSMVSM